MSSFIKLLISLGLIAVLVVLASVPLEWKSQAIFGAILFVIAFAIDQRSRSRQTTVVLMVISVFCTTRYLWWRVSETFNYLAVNGAQTGWGELFAVSLLLGAELYAFVILILGYFQNIRPLDRKPIALPDDPSLWPSVDVLIPTFNEPLEVIRTTVLAALAMDWPKQRLRVSILDDGKRPEIHALAEACGAGYLARLDNEGAKAGNINHALRFHNSDYVAIFDSDHVPTRSFLQLTMGMMVANRRLAMVQTPHHFYSPDPFERNLDTFRRVPNEGELFYGVVQDGNDFWNSAFFCGSCAVLRRSALDQVGGVATETVTEDSHTALRLHKIGWQTAYLKIPQAAGLATANISDHITQRIRWARGMVQVLRVENPLFSRSLSMAQRLCYFNSGLHFLHALPRLIFLTAPLIYLLFGTSNLYGYVWAILAYVFPHLLMAALTNSRIHGRYRHSFWNEVFETVLAPYIVLPTLLALVNPRWGKFNVTPKRSVVEKSYFDLRIAIPFLILLALNATGFGIAMSHLLSGQTDPGTLIVNMMWTLLNVLILGASLAVLWEKRQLRSGSRVGARYPALLLLADGTEVQGVTLDFSLSGVAIQMNRPIDLVVGDRATLVIAVGGERHDLPVEVRRDRGLRLGLRFNFSGLADHQAVTRLMFGRADAWILWNEGRQEDRPMRSLGRLVVISLRAILLIPKGLFSRPGPVVPSVKKPARQPVMPALLVAAALTGFLATRADAAEPFIDQRDLATLGQLQPVTIRGAAGQASFSFGIPVTKVVTDAGLTLRFHASGGFRPDSSKLQFALNSVAIGAVALSSATTVDGVGQIQIDLPSDLIVADNNLTIHFSGNCLSGCRDTVDWFRVETSTSVRLAGNLLPMANNLSLLPAPFVDTTTHSAVRVPIVFAASPDSLELQAAGVIASWIGMMADDRGAAFPARIGEPSSENAIVLALADAPIIQKLGLGKVTSPMLALRDNPADPYSKLLVVSGTDSAQLLAVAQALATGAFSRQGPDTDLSGYKPPAAVPAFDAPRWLNPDRGDTLTKGASPEQLRVFGAGSVNLYFRLPPDLSFGQRSTVPLRLSFRTSGASSPLRGEVRVRLNEVGVAAVRFDAAEGANVIRQTVELPVSALYPSNTLTVEFAYLPGKSQQRPEVFPEALILPTTAIDLRKIPRFVQLPRMDLFAESGFPFTRYSDLATTAVAIPDVPTADEISLYLGLMGRFGGQTGSPALRVTVVPASKVETASSKDLLVVGTLASQPLVSRWASSSPVQLIDAGVRLTPAYGLRGWMRSIPFTSAFEQSRRITDMSGEHVDGIVQGFPSPLDSSQNAVIVAATDSQTLLPLILAVSSDRSTGIAGTASILRDGSFQGFYIETDSNYLGRLSLRENFYNWIAARFWVIAVLVVLAGIPLARWFCTWADRHAELRLQGLR